jgi:hypothetical protein
MSPLYITHEYSDGSILAAAGVLLLSATTTSRPDPASTAYAQPNTQPFEHGAEPGSSA